jgi:hypothetical protein
VFRVRRQDKPDPQHIYHKIVIEFQKLLLAAGLDDRKEGMRRRKITFHSFRRFAKTAIANNTSTDYSEWFLGHGSKSPYYTQKEKERRLLYATKCMPFLTFTNYSKLEEDAARKSSELEMLMIKDANKDRELELLRQRVSIKDQEIELIRKRDLAKDQEMLQIQDQIESMKANSIKIETMEDRIIKLQSLVEEFTLYPPRFQRKMRRRRNT